MATARSRNRIPAMITPRFRLLSLALVSCLACDGTSSTEAALSSSGATLSAINASAAQFVVVLDADSVLHGVQVGGVSGPVAISAGTHRLRLVSGTTASAPITIVARAGEAVFAVGRGASSADITPSVLSDTGAIVPAGKSKLRVVHLSASAGNIEIWRTQPDYQTPIHIMTPFAYAAESPYLQSDPGNWEVFITAAGSTAKLATTGAVNIPSGERRTAVLLDSAGRSFFRILPE